MGAPGSVVDRLDGVGDIGLLGGQPGVEGLALAFFPGRHAELVGLAPALGGIDDDVAVVIAQFVGVGTFARVQGVARAALLGEVRGIHLFVGFGVIAHAETVARAFGGLHAGGAI